MNKKVDKVNDKKKKSVKVNVTPASNGGGTPFDKSFLRKKEDIKIL